MVIKTFWKPITGKGKTLKPTKVSPWKLSMNKPVKAFYGDSDGDGVMNMFDCQPHNKKKQGEEHRQTIINPKTGKIVKTRKQKEEYDALVERESERGSPYDREMHGRMD